jgi:hexosaminidase
VFKSKAMMGAAVCCLLAFARAEGLVPLIPQPQERGSERIVPLTRGFSVSAGESEEDRFAAADLTDTLKKRGISVTRGTEVSLRVRLLRAENPVAKKILSERSSVFTPATHDEGYFLIANGSSVTVIGETAAGIFYGIQTLKQLIVGQGRSAVFHATSIRDWPAMKYRGLDDDLSRGPIPTLEFQKQQIRTLAAYKINIYSPYFENTLTYSDNPLPGLPGGAMTKEDVKSLVAYALQYHITVIPEQEAFGHLHHVLTFEQYSPLAETPHGSVLAPGQSGSLKLIQQWFVETANMFPSKFLHIGADETFELGTGQTSAAVKSEGLGPVYIEFLKDIATALAPLNRRLLFWGDIAMKSPDLVKTLPKDMIAVAWTYSPQPKGFEPWLKPFLDAGMETWVAPGVNNWNRVFPDNDMALRNIQGFVSTGQRMGSTGVLNTVWNDDGEGLFLQDWYGVLYGAAAGWQSGSSDIETFEEAYGPVFHGDTTGALNQAQRELTAAHLVLKGAGLDDARNTLFWLDPWSMEGQDVSRKLLPVVKEFRLHAERALTLIAQARRNPDLQEVGAVDAMDLGARRMDFLAFKFQAADEIVRYYSNLYDHQTDPAVQADVRNLFRNLAGTNGRCEDLRDGFSYLKSEYRDIWLRENRPYWLDNVLGRYDLAIQLWIGRSDSFKKAAYEWQSKHTLPKPEELGMPSAPVSDN